MRYFYDTEFIDNGRIIDLISIGVVAEDGREFYAVSTEFDPESAGRWVRTNVLPKLPSPASALWRSRRQIREGLEEFLGVDGDEPIELWAWVGAYDHVALCQLWGPMTESAPADSPFHQRVTSGVGRPRLPAHAAPAARHPRCSGRRAAQHAALPADGRWITAGGGLPRRGLAQLGPVRMVG